MSEESTEPRGLTDEEQEVMAFLINSVVAGVQGMDAFIIVTGLMEVIHDVAESFTPEFCADVARALEKMAAHLHEVAAGAAAHEQGAPIPPPVPPTTTLH